jgi:ankyrin repeat protein
MSLAMAAFLGDRSRVIELLSAGADPDSQDEFGQSALTLALEGAHRDEEDQSWRAGHEHFAIVEGLLARGAHVRGPGNESLLQNAVRLENPQFFDLLVGAGADPNARATHGTALLVASALGRTIYVKRLLELDADPNILDSGEWSPLHRACALDGVDIVRLLLEKGARVNVSGMPLVPHPRGGYNSNWSPPGSWPYGRSEPFGLPYLLMSGWMPLHVAICELRVNSVILLLAHGADPRAQTAFGWDSFRFIGFLEEHPPVDLTKKHD